MPRPVLERVVAGVLIAALAAVVVVAIAKHAVEVPTGDSWEMVPLLAAWHDGRLAPADLWRLHNEHRVVVPRVAMLFLASVSEWSARWEIAANFLLALATFGSLAATLAVTVAPRSATLARALAVVAAAFVFSLVQWENWTWGWQMSIFLNAAAAAAATAALARWPGRWRGFALASGAAVVGMLSFASGIVLVWLVPVAFAVQRDAGRLRATLPGFALAATLTAAYFHGYVSPANHPPPSFAWTHPMRALEYGLAQIGGPLVPRDAVPAAVAYGTLGATIFAVGGAASWRMFPALRPLLVPWGLLGGFVLGSAAVSAIGRTGMGAGQALSSRYTTVTGLFWVAALALGGLAGHGLIARGGSARTMAVLGVALAVVLGVGWTRGVLNGVEGLGWREARLRRGRACVLQYATADDECLRLLYPLPIRERAAQLEAMRLGPFARAER